MIKHFMIIILILFSIEICYADIGYNTINLIDYDTNKFIHINTSIPLSNYTFELKTGLNWIGIPFNTSIKNADDLIRDIQPSCNRVGWWNATSQMKETYSKFFGGYIGTNFKVYPLHGYEIKSNSNALWTIECFQPTKTIIEYNIFDLNRYIGTNIVRVINI